VSDSALDPVLDELWERRDGLTPDDVDARKLVHEALDALDRGDARIAQVDPATDAIVVDERAKRSILLAFKTFPMSESSAGDFVYRDRMPLKKRLDGVRTVPGAIVRFGAYLAPGVVCMPSFVNIGGYVDTGSMVDTWATVGSCAQIGRNVHLSGGVGIGGVLEPAQAAPVVIEDDVFVGSRSMVVEGARVRPGAKLGAGTILTASTHVVDAATGQEYARGEAPAGAVCVGSTRVKSFPGGDFGMPVVLVLRVLTSGERHDKLVLNDVLREHGVAP
jgi:2,3,4,5-tetrahydropyridine-2-carboxylate N-succinyltransferase